jgi:hypothetical protein
MVGGSPAMQHRGGNADSTLRAMRRLPEMETYEIPDPKDPKRMHKKTRGSENLWTQTNLSLGRDNGIRAIAVAGDALLVGLEVTNRDRWKERAEIPYRLQVLAFADGTVRQQLALPRRPLPGGISSDDGRVFVTSEDGTISAFGP